MVHYKYSKFDFKKPDSEHKVDLVPLQQDSKTATLVVLEIIIYTL